MADNHPRLALVMEAIAIGYCKDCAHRNDMFCTHERLTGAGVNVDDANDQLVSSHFEKGTVITGDYFGCVHFEE